MRIERVQSGGGKLNVRVLVITADKFEDLELLVPYFRLLDEGARVDIAAPTMDEIEGENGYRITPDLTIESVDPDHYDAVLVPGGAPDGAPSVVRHDEFAQAIVRSFSTKGKPIATICHGPWLLASANVIEGKRLTSYWHDGVPEDVVKAGGMWIDQAVVVDGNLVSSRWPPDLPAFTFEMMKIIRQWAES